MPIMPVPSIGTPNPAMTSPLMQAPSPAMNGPGTTPAAQNQGVPQMPQASPAAAWGSYHPY